MSRFHLVAWARFGKPAVFSATLVCLTALFAGQSAFAQLPAARLNSIFPPGGKQSATVEVTIAGTDLDLVNQLIFTHAGITAAPKTREPGPFEQGPQLVPNQFTVKIATNVPPGLYEVRAVGKFGITNPRAFQIGDLDEVVEKEANNRPEQATEVEINTLINGRANSATDIDYFKFAAKKGQRLIIDCWATRIDSRLDASLAIYDSAGRELESNRDMNSRDPLIDFTPPADGVYLLKLQDAIYGGSADYFYRLSITTRPYIDYIMPNSGEPGKTSAFVLYGRNLPGGTPAGVSIDGKPLQKLSVQIAVPGGAETQKLNISTLLEPESSSIDGFEYRFKGSGGTSNPILIGFAAAPVVLEQEPNTADKPQKVSVPCEFVGQSQTSRDRDYIAFDAKAGEIFWLEMISHRQGIPLDPYFLLEQLTVDKEGKPVLDKEGAKTYRLIVALDDSMPNIGGTSFNTQSDDLSYRLAVPKDGSYRVMIRDLYNRGNPRYVYRLAIRREQPDFRLAAIARFPSNNVNTTNMWSTLLRKGGTEAMQIVAFRRDGFNGDIQVTVEGLPPGVTQMPLTLGPNQKNATLVLRAADNVKDWAGTIRIVGKAKIGGKETVREARGGAVIWPGVQNQSAPARLTRSIALAVTSKETADFLVSIGDGKLQEMSRAGTIVLPIKVTQRNGFKGNIQLTIRDLVNGIKIGNVNLGNKTTGKVTVTLPVKTAVGTYTFHMVAQSQVNYSRNKELVAGAKKEKERIDKLVVQLTAESKKAAAAAKSASKDAKAAAQKAAQEAASKLKAAQAYQKQAAARVTSLTNAAKPKKTNVFVPTTAFTIKVTASPITFTADQKPAKLKQGAKLEIPVTITRLYKYADAVQLEFLPPGGVSGLKLVKATIAKGQTQGKLTLEAAANATPGTHSLTVRATARLNNQNLQITQILSLTIEAVKKPKKK